MSTRAAAILLAILLVLGILFALAVPVPAEPVRGTGAFDYRNSPNVGATSGYELLVLSPLSGLDRLDSARVQGARAWRWVQPWLCTWQGRPIWRQAWDLAEARNSFLRDTTGARVVVNESDVSACWVLDYRDTVLADSMAAWYNAWVADGIYLDYGCEDLSWLWSARAVARSVWPAWAKGYGRIKTQIAGEAGCGCSLTSLNASGCDVLYLEGIPGFYSYLRTLELTRDARARGKRGLVFCQTGVKWHRRCLAGISLLADALFNWRDFNVAGGTWNNLRDPEHFDLWLGNVWGDIWEPSPRIYRKQFTHGMVIVNLSTSSWKYGSRWIAPNDALVIQFRDRVTGQWITWRTNEGR